MELEVAKFSKQILTIIACALGTGVVLMTIYSYEFDVTQVAKSTTVDEIGEGLLNYGEGGFILPFEVISVLLLAAMIGAIIIAKGKKLKGRKD